MSANLAAFTDRARRAFAVSSLRRAGDMRRERGAHFLGGGKALMAFLFTLFGTNDVMSTEHRQRKPELVAGVLKIPFSSHNFSAACFDTLSCRVTYNGRYVAKKDEPSPPLTEAIRGNLDGNWGGIDNFPSPAHVVWTSKDGSAHEA
ncbi:hypothetical protein ACQKIE_09315 [Luteibacter sp. NPDC031894]|uniref:hypothetical protein n=1 Tax=Luteibacter sp. NPDC031894 TaxID=3390572 RepID=UPI003CFC1A91